MSCQAGDIVALKEAEIAQLKAHIDRTWNDADCRRCGGNKWGVHGVVKIDTTSLNTHPAFGRDLALPTAVLVCQTCGATEGVNLVVAGVVSQ